MKTLPLLALSLSPVLCVALLLRCSASTPERLQLPELPRKELARSACITELVLSVPPDAGVPTDPRTLTNEDLELEARLVAGVRKCGQLTGE